MVPIILGNPHISALLWDPFPHFPFSKFMGVAHNDLCTAFCKPPVAPEGLGFRGPRVSQGPLNFENP